jgi:HSP20 family protein
MLGERSLGRAVESLYYEVDRMFDDFWRGMEREALAPAMWGFEGAVPATDQTEDAKAFYVTLELPGMDEKDVELSLSDNVLTIRGERKLDKEEKERNTYLRERSYGAFRRSISLPVEVDEPKVKAKFKKGVLSITLQKTKEGVKKAKRIAIETK